MRNKNETPANMFTVAPGVWGMKHVFVNFYMLHDEENNNWILVDAGLKWSSLKIKEMAEHLFGMDSKPNAIILTHGHFDHVGSVKSLADEWDVAVYAHPLEIPYLTGHSDYPPADPTVGGGLMASLACLYPVSPINIWKHIKALPADGTVPFMNEWKYIHTPGHTSGHISLFRESDGVLIAGDAFVTTKAESVTAIMFQSKILSGPPKYLTSDWHAAKASVDTLSYLQPQTAATGHGMPMRGEELKTALHDLANNFYEKAVPEHGRYVPHPAISDENGVIYIPPKKPNKNHVVVKAFTTAALVSLAVVWFFHKKKKRRRLNEDLLDVEYNY